MQSSIEHPEKIDLITADPVSGEYALIISATGDWEDSEEEQALLLQKINNYLNFIVDGDLAQHYPQTRGMPTRIQIDSSTNIPKNIERLIFQAQELLLQHDIKLCINLLRQ